MQNASNDQSNSKSTATPPPVGGRYAKYVLAVLVIVYIFNFIDRQILSILAEEIKADLGISDAEMGFLYGTAFAVFYAVFGIPLGRLADTWTRKKLISIGLLFWSLMTTLSGTARSFGVLASYRIGVGIGEASASPASYSMISDYFSPKLRTTALSVYASGVYIGMGIGMFLGGLILDEWTGLYPDSQLAPFQLKGWHVAFFMVGLPGVIMAFWAWTLKEPLRGQSEGLLTPPDPHPFREAFAELMAIIPPFHLARLITLGAGTKGIAINIIVGCAVALFGYSLYQLTGSLIQWVTLSIGIFSGFCWAQSLSLRDPACFAMIFKCKTVMYVMIGFPFIAFVAYGLNFWIPPFFQRIHGVSASEAGKVLGLSIAVGGWAGVIIGGVVADKLRQTIVEAKLYVSMGAILLSTPCAIGVLLSDNITLAYIFNFLFALTSAMWIGPAAATVNDLVMPRMRAISSAFYLMMTTFIGLSLGPYTMGRISDMLIAQGKSPAEGLTSGMLLGLTPYIIALVLLLLAARNIKQDEGSRLERAEAHGELITKAT